MAKLQQLFSANQAAKCLNTQTGSAVWVEWSYNRVKALFALFA